MRPAEIADDHCGITDVIAHTTRCTLDAGWPLAAVGCIYPTTRIFAAHIIPVDIPRWRVQDIDTPDDWTRAEALFTALGGAGT